MVIFNSYVKLPEGTPFSETPNGDLMSGSAVLESTAAFVFYAPDAICINTEIPDIEHVTQKCCTFCWILLSLKLGNQL